ncbi:hypothetical protein E2C01_037013 [Portunus trituberculatus]|uniref:Uncharacterized protein n=1 Tax=Portunus trituberculatus TaxID=210409 RepID=A0A5B7FE85_PORTR|nr:hypothetical protein [Portunus trituberculatus]
MLKFWGGRSSHAEEKKYLQYEIMDKFTEEDGSTRLYVSRESLFSAPSAWPIPHDAPYKAHLDRQLLAVLGAGLYDKWTADILTQTKLSSQRRQRQRQAADQQERAVETKDMSKEGTPILTLSHTQGGFILLMAGLGEASEVRERGRNSTSAEKECYEVLIDGDAGKDEGRREEVSLYYGSEAIEGDIERGNGNLFTYFRFCVLLSFTDNHDRRCYARDTSLSDNQQPERLQANHPDHFPVPV